MANIYRNPLSKTVRKNPSIQRTPLNLENIFLGEVIYVEHSGMTAGYISYRWKGSVGSDIIQNADNIGDVGLKSANVAQPLLANIKIYPVVGEQVILFNFGNVYYLPLNVLNNPVINQAPALFKGTSKNRIDNTAKIDSNTKNTFSINPNSVYRITNVEPGDIVLEGRSGNSIKFGSTVKRASGVSNTYSKSDLSNNGDPIMIIRNAPGGAGENIQLDGASIYLCSTQKVLVDQGKNGFEGITGTWSTLNVSGENVEIEEIQVIENTSATSPDSSRPGNPTPPDPDNQSSTTTSSNTQALSDPGFVQPSSGGPVNVAPPSTGYLKPGNLTISSEGLKDLIREEGSRRQVYDDKTGKAISSYAESQGYPTIGVGHLITAKEYSKFEKYLKGKQQMTDDEIQKLLLSDLGPRIRLLNNKLKAEVTQNMFDSLLSMMFNTGSGNRFFREAIRLTNQKKYQEAAAIIKEGPVTSKGQVVAGLVRRRTNESNTYIA